jgi:transglutaminase-like putative cysteine protease
MRNQQGVAAFALRPVLSAYFAMDTITVRHVTRYRYARPVAFGEHRMMFRPRASFDQHVLEYRLTITPAPDTIRYVHDVFGNCIGLARFSAQATSLTFDSSVRLEHTPECSLDFPESPDLARNSYPFAYQESDLPDLYSSMLRTRGEEGKALAVWARRFLDGVVRVDAPHVLATMTRAIHTEFDYRPRESGPAQSPLVTLRLRAGTCRDFAVLMVEAARELGLAARFVSGYLYVPPRNFVGTARQGGGNTHAWVRVFLPHGGWAEYDPTNGLVGNRDLIRVAVVRDPAQAVPLSGCYEGRPEDYLGMDVNIDVTVEPLGAAEKSPC